MTQKKLQRDEYPEGFVPFRTPKDGNFYSTNGLEVHFHSVGKGDGWTDLKVAKIDGELLEEARKHGYKG